MVRRKFETYERKILINEHVVAVFSMTLFVDNLFERRKIYSAFGIRSQYIIIIQKY